MSSAAHLLGFPVSTLFCTVLRARLLLRCICLASLSLRIPKHLDVYWIRKWLRLLPCAEFPNTELRGRPKSPNPSARQPPRRVAPLVPFISPGRGKQIRQSSEPVSPLSPSRHLTIHQFADTRFLRPYSRSLI